MSSKLPLPEALEANVSIGKDAATTGTPMQRPLEGGLSASVPRMVLLAGVVVGAFFLGSGFGTWSLGVVSCMMGLAVVMAPPLFRLPRGAVLSLLVIGLVPLVGVLPASWLGMNDAWRASLWESWGIAVSRTVSPDPRASFESWLVIMAGVIWLWTCLGQRASDEGRRWCIYVLAMGGAAIAVASWVDHSMHVFSWWPRTMIGGSETFGPMANRNHTSSLNAISCILCAASAYDAYRRRSYFGWVFALLFWAPLSAIFMNTSRGGLILFFVGIIAWMTTAAMKKGLFRKMSVGLAVLLVVISVAVVSSGRLGERLRGLLLVEKVSLLTSSMRVDLARETLALVTERPWLGHGFDSFTTVFPIISKMEAPAIRFLHPESDLLQLFFEGGLLALLPCVVLLVWLVRCSGPWRKAGGRDKSTERAGRRLRQAAAIGAGMALLHSLFDVPNHGVAYAMHTSLLLGLAIRPRKLKVASGGLQRMTFRVAGLAIVALGVMWTGIAYQKWTPDLPTSVPILQAKLLRETQQGRYREALVILDRTIWLAPLDYRLYYLRAQILLQLRQRPERALWDFGRSRALEPHYANLCFEEGVYWLRFSPEMAIIPWRECLRRLPRDSGSLHQTYESMLSTIALYPELRPPLWNMAEGASMHVTFLKTIPSGPEWEKYLALFLQTYPNLETVDADHLTLLLRMWHEKGDRAALVKLVHENPRLQPYAWRTVAVEYAREGKYDEAVEMAAKFLKRPSRPVLSSSADLKRLEKAFVFNPTDVRPGIELFIAQRAAGDIEAAKATAKKVIAIPDAPAYMKLELASIFMELKDPRQAWDLMEQVMAAFPEA